MNARILAVAVSALTASAAVGQINPNIGTSLSLTDDSTATVTSSFPVTFPDGSVVTDINVDSNGRVTAPATPTDLSESVFDLLNDPSSIAVFWDDLNPASANSPGNVFFNDLGTSLLITWSDIVIFGGAAGTDFTVQLEILANSTFIVRADSRVPAADGMVGLSAGNGATDPGVTDISFNAPINTGSVSTIYEIWDGGTFVYDLGNSDTTFAPNGMGGYNVTTTAPRGTRRPVPAVATANGNACIPNGDSLTFTPDGSGGYNVSVGGAADLSFAGGMATGITDDGILTVPIGFSFTMPGGTVLTDIEILGNGRLQEPGFGDPTPGVFQDFTENVADFLNDPSSFICVFWDDFNPTTAGEVWVNSPVGGGLSVTWDGVPQFGTTDSNTFQAILRPDNSIVMTWFAMDAIDGLVGLSPGNGAADPGSMDLSAGGISTAGNPVVYQLFDAANGDNDLGLASLPSLAALNTPIIGTTFDLQITSPNPTIGEFYLIGNPFSFNLSPLGINCTLLTDSVLGTLPGTTGVPLSIAIPFIPSLIGSTLVSQGATLDIAAGNPFFVLFTNSVDFTFGNI